jgi:hypothetical protein
VIEKCRQGEERCGLAEGEEIFLKSRGGSGISTLVHTYTEDLDKLMRLVQGLIYTAEKTSFN